jgi:hypothetical protein
MPGAPLRRSSSLVLVVVLAAVALSSGAAQASLKKATATSVLKAAHTALSKQTSVHIDVTSKAGKVQSTIAVDVGAKTGVEKLATGKEHVSIRLTSGYVYLSGNASGLVSMMGLTTKQQKKVGTRWITMKSGSTEYKNFESTLTSPVLLRMLPLAKGTSLSTDAKTGDYVLRWSTAASGSTPKTTDVLTMSSKGKVLPIKEVITSSTGGGTTTFSKWGESFNVSVPSSTITYAKVFG